jgi:hypothetical protein
VVAVGPAWYLVAVAEVVVVERGGPLVAVAVALVGAAQHLVSTAVAVELGRHLGEVMLALHLGAVVG